MADIKVIAKYELKNKIFELLRYGKNVLPPTIMDDIGGSLKNGEKIVYRIKMTMDYVLVKLENIMK